MYVAKLQADLDLLNQKIDAATGLGIEPTPAQIEPVETANQTEAQGQ